jgi:hypothetical protein
MKPQTSQTDQQKTGLIEAEIQHNIPVKLHDSQIPSNPINSAKNAQQLNKNGEELDDKVLQDVNKAVKETDNKPPKKSLFSFRKKQISTQTHPAKLEKLEVQKGSKTAKPVLTIVIAMLVATVLSTTAFYAFSTKKPGTSAANPTGTLSKGTSTSKTSGQSDQSAKITSSDLTKASTDLNSKIDALNDTQEFNTADLSDANLGL